MVINTKSFLLFFISFILFSFLFYFYLFLLFLFIYLNIYFLLESVVMVEKAAMQFDLDILVEE